MIKSGMAVVYWPVGETCGICCHKHSLHQLYIVLFHMVHMQLMRFNKHYYEYHILT